MATGSPAQLDPSRARVRQAVMASIVDRTLMLDLRRLGRGLFFDPNGRHRTGHRPCLPPTVAPAMPSMGIADRRVLSGTSNQASATAQPRTSRGGRSGGRPSIRRATRRSGVRAASRPPGFGADRRPDGAQGSRVGPVEIGLGGTDLEARPFEKADGDHRAEATVERFDGIAFGERYVGRVFGVAGAAAGNAGLEESPEPGRAAGTPAPRRAQGARAARGRRWGRRRRARRRGCLRPRPRRSHRRRSRHR